MLDSDFISVNIREYLAVGDDGKTDETALREIVSGFSCPTNPDVEAFLKQSAIDFAKKNRSVTSPFQNRVEIAKSLFGIIPAEISFAKAREERLAAK